ncbi:MAG: bacteriohemerythrin [Treponema sp.]|jgi:hemerythrin|nr:bacteriohemerythrin [Treponema sp.]
MAEKFMEWDDRLSMGIPLIDKQHQRLIEITNNLYEACRQGGSLYTSFVTALRETVDYVGFHFGTEEKIMRRINYPDYALHKREHEAFVKEVLKQKLAYENDKAYAPHAMVRYLRDWTLSHIALTDLKLGAYLLNMKKTGALENVLEKFIDDKSQTL